MSASAFALALGAAALHATWNALLARAEDVRAAAAVALVVAVGLFAPLAALTWDVEVEAVPWIVASAAFEVLYVLLLTSAYHRSDLSLVYPIARGAAPVLVLVGATLAGASLGLAQAIGVALVGVGVVLVRDASGHVDRRGVALSLAIGVTIASYTLIDNEGVEHAAPLPYLVLVLAPSAAVLLAGQVARGGAPRLRAAFTWSSVLAGIFSLAAYGLALAALELAPAASVAAVRETGILFAVALGAIALHERVSPARLVGALLMVGGVALVALG